MKEEDRESGKTDTREGEEKGEGGEKGKGRED